MHGPFCELAAVSAHLKRVLVLIRYVLMAITYIRAICKATKGRKTTWTTPNISFVRSRTKLEWLVLITTFRVLVINDRFCWRKSFLKYQITARVNINFGNVCSKIKHRLRHEFSTSFPLFTIYYLGDIFDVVLYVFIGEVSLIWKFSFLPSTDLQFVFRACETCCVRRLNPFQKRLWAHDLRLIKVPIALKWKWYDHVKIWYMVQQQIRIVTWLNLQN